MKSAYLVNSTFHNQHQTAEVKIPADNQPLKHLHTYLHDTSVADYRKTHHIVSNKISNTALHQHANACCF